MNTISSMMGEQRVLPIIQANNEDEGLNIARAIHAAGINAVEVVLRSERAAQVITAIKQNLPEMIVSAGTVVDEASYVKAVNAGADFIITPGFSPALLDILSGSEIPTLPGVASVAEIIVAREHGYRELKFFPAGIAGGPAFLKAVQSLFQDTRFCPTGGVSGDNYEDYLALNNVFAVGGTWVVKPQWVKDGQWDEITQACKAAK